MRRTRIAALVLLACAGPACTYRGSAGLVKPSAERVRAAVSGRAGADAPAPGAGACASDPVVASLLAQPLTEEAAVRLALLQNGTVRASYERLGIARADLLQAGLLSNPVFTIDAKGFSAGPEIELGLSRSFVDLFFLQVRRRVAQADLRAEEAAVARDLIRLVYDVRRAFVVVRSAEAVAALREQALARATASRDLMQKLHAAGNALDTVRTLEEAEAARSQLDLDASEALVRDAREPLSVLLGLQGDQVRWTLAGGPLEAPGEALPPAAEAQALAASLDLVEGAARIEAALCRAGRMRSEGRLPGLDAGVVGKRESSGAWGLGPSLVVVLPLFDQGQARHLAASAELRQRVARHSQLAVEVASAARRLQARLTALEARLRYLREVYLPLRERLVSEGLQFFNAMQIGAFDVLHAKQLELDARREQAETVRDTWLARLDLGELLAGSLNPARLAPLSFPDEAEHPELPKGH